MDKVLYVGIGGFIGASLRFIIGGWALKSFGDNLPYGTLIVNVLASLVIGFIMEGSLNAWAITPNVKLLLTTGILGGLSTFSTFSYETISLLSSNYLLGSFNVILNLFLSLFGVLIGKYLVQFV